METLFNITSNSSCSSPKTHKDSTFFPFSSLSLKSNNRVSFQVQDFQPFVASRKKILKCVSSDERMVKTYDEKAGLKKKNLAVFFSGGGSNFRAVHQVILSGDVHGQFVVLVTNKHGGIVVLLDGACKYEIDFILLAGYLKLMPSQLIQAYPNSILNIHPLLLPTFGGKGYYGTNVPVHKAVIASGARYSGPTIHFVDENYDTRRILAQTVVPVLANDTAKELAARILRQEHKMYAEVAAAVCEERVIWREEGVPIIADMDVIIIQAIGEWRLLCMLSC